jgi:hypothetical protein
LQLFIRRLEIRNGWQRMCERVDEEGKQRDFFFCRNTLDIEHIESHGNAKTIYFALQCGSTGQ